MGFSLEDFTVISFFFGWKSFAFVADANWESSRAFLESLDDSKKSGMTGVHPLTTLWPRSQWLELLFHLVCTKKYFHTDCNKTPFSSQKKETAVN